MLLAVLTGKKKYTHVKNIEQIQSYLRDTGLKHKVIQTANTVKIECSEGNYIGFFEYLKKRDLTLIARVKRHVIDNNIEYKKKIKDIHYVTKKMPEKIPQRQIYGIDISKAYWFTAYHEGFISEKIFKEGLKKKYSKKARLIAIGALASQPVISVFDGKRYKVQKSEILPTANIFFRCAEVVNDLMAVFKIVLNKSFLFYWVDCVYFVGNDKIPAVTDILQKNGYSFTVEAANIEALDIDKKTITLQKNTGKKATYSFTKNN